MTNLVVTILNLLLALGIFGSLKLAWPVGLSLILFLLWLALNSFLASQILIKIFSLPKISAISKGPADAFLPDKATLRGHNKNPLSRSG